VGDIIFLESTLVGSMVTALAFAGAQDLLNRLAQTDRRILVGLGILAAFAFIHPTSRRILLARAPEVGRALGSGLHTGLRIWTEHIVEWGTLSSEAQSILAAYRRTGERPPHVRERAATVLARADTSLSLSEIRRNMRAWDSAPAGSNDTSYLRRMLRAHPEQFIETDGGRWFLAVRRVRPTVTTS